MDNTTHKGGGRMSYNKLSFYLLMIGVGGLGLFNATKLEIRYATNSNAELLCQNAQIISSAAIAYFLLAFIVEILVMKSAKIENSKTKSNKKQSKPKDSDKIVKGAYRLIPNDNNTPKDGEVKEEE